MKRTTHHSNQETTFQIKFVTFLSPTPPTPPPTPLTTGLTTGYAGGESDSVRSTMALGALPVVTGVVVVGVVIVPGIRRGLNRYGCGAPGGRCI